MFIKYISVYIYNYYTRYTSGDGTAAVQAVLDGGEGNDKLTVDGNAEGYAGRGDVTANGGAGNDEITGTAKNAGTTQLSGNSYGFASVAIDGGDGADKIRVSGGLQVNITTGKLQ